MFTGARSSKWLWTADRTAWSQGHVAVQPAVELRRGRRFGIGALPAIADDILVLPILSIFVLSLTAGRAEIALFGLSTAAHTGRIMWVVDTSKVASHLTTTAWDTCLVYALVLLL